jgi:hypothetical protein
VLAVIGLFTVKLVLAVLAGIASFVGFLLFTVLPIVLLGWLALRILDRFREKPAS